MSKKMTAAERDEVLDEVLAALRSVSTSVWVDDPDVQRWAPIYLMKRALIARVSNMKSENYIMGA